MVWSCGKLSSGEILIARGIRVYSSTVLSVTPSLKSKNLTVLLQPALPFGNLNGHQNLEGEKNSSEFFEQQSPPRALREFLMIPTEP
jgi:hypothetical protein